ncbi:formylmethanofuran dehydrogenase subunit A [Candidatus Nitrosoglobus terrae]|uniref:Formylmethanofuran dehydrogenase subunit A n=1 Tax=Candidatus Nitrosoglobus terrae TaxID=1630141 RepID=A0A1Q2SJS7_9GAMM|nr:formylmethanofuran dehydrogenase subunit A [Candidatus Nitrosoglobus terrae]BAW79379.1 formylmethanofuran dehydrogenase subunit A [Candidatus Nitrosoglobus terrae]
MLIKLTSGTVYDPMHGIKGEVRSIYIRDGRIIDPPSDAPAHQEYNLHNKIVMAGAIDIHTHIGGGKINIARTLLSEDHRAYSVAHTDLLRSGSGRATPSAFITGYQYAKLGYTTAFEPAILPMNARHSHLEMGDIPIIDKGGYALLGNDDYMLRILAANKDQKILNNYVAWIITASQCLGVKVVNPGGINAFKFNQRQLNLDEPGPYYGVTPRQILLQLARAVYELGIPHPLHVHGCNLGVPGNLKTTLKTIAGSEGLPMHLTHIQFHSYGTEGDRKFSSGAAQIAEAINNHPNITIDVGQIFFGQTTSVSADSMQQYASYGRAYPKKGVFMDIECDSGCGVVPFKYKDKSFVNSLQWAIGLEIFLLVTNPWQICLTTDHPNGAPFITYPHLIRLLMDRSFRNDMLTTIHPDAAQVSILSTLNREYSLYEIAIITRAGAAKLLGLSDRGHLGIGAVADITVYTQYQDKERMFAKPDYVFKNGEMVAKNGEIVKVTQGATHVVRPAFDNSIEKDLNNYFDRYLSLKLSNFKIRDEEILQGGHSDIQIHPCHREASL